jgi:hypothetical protein
VVGRRREELGFEGVGLEGAGHEEALGLVDVGFSEEVHLIGGFHAFGKSGQAEVLAELYEGADEGFGLGRRGDGVSEGAVDLEAVNGELAQVGQRRVGGAEVIDSDPDS